MDPVLQADVSRHLRMDTSAFDYDRPRHALAEALTAEDISWFDLHDALLSGEERLYINNDIHLNIEGNRRVAEALRSMTRFTMLFQP